MLQTVLPAHHLEHDHTSRNIKGRDEVPGVIFFILWLGCWYTSILVFSLALSLCSTPPFICIISLGYHFISQSNLFKIKQKRLRPYTAMHFIVSFKTSGFSEWLVWQGCLKWHDIIWVFFSAFARQSQCVWCMMRDVWYVCVMHDVYVWCVMCDVWCMMHMCDVYVMRDEWCMMHMTGDAWKTF